jgi:hypothetical protein
LVHHTPYVINKLYQKTIVEDSAMTPHVLPGAIPYVLPEVEYGVVRDIAIKAFYFFLVAAAFVFVSILLTGIHP